MKRSEINQIIRDAEKFLASRQFVLPEWANWSLADWQANKDRVEYIAEPGGSVRDADVIQTADHYGIAMCFTGMRLFHH